MTQTGNQKQWLRHTNHICGSSRRVFPLSTTLPIFIGGMLKGIVDKMQGVKEESEVSSGMLYSTGLVAGGALSGIPITTMVDGQPKESSLMQSVLDSVGVHGWEQLGAGADVIGAMMFGFLEFIL